LDASFDIGMFLALATMKAMMKALMTQRLPKLLTRCGRDPPA
jgi:hypothetical protein